jgi:DNA-binding MarR family transcriptional regulator
MNTMKDTQQLETVSFLLAQVCKLFRQKVQIHLSDLGLHVGQEKVLLHLWRQDGLTLSEMAEQLCVQPATVTTMLNRMIKARLVEKRQDTEDRRVSRVYLTAYGRSLHQPLTEIWADVEAMLLLDLTREEQILLRRLLLQVYQNLTT